MKPKTELEVFTHKVLAAATAERLFGAVDRATMVLRFRRMCRVLHPDRTGGDRRATDAMARLLELRDEAIDKFARETYGRRNIVADVYMSTPNSRSKTRVPVPVPATNQTWWRWFVSLPLREPAWSAGILFGASLEMSKQSTLGLFLMIGGGIFTSIVVERWVNAFMQRRKRNRHG